MKHSFQGYYFKHQNGDQTLCLIVGRSDSGRFLQIITNEFSKKIPFPEGVELTRKGISLSVKEPGLTLSGRIRYGRKSPIRYDIMGPFCLIPMECRHGIISMEHRLKGKVSLNGTVMDFTGGKGYMEMDSGRSFPSAYAWIQANDFKIPCSIMASAAVIPFLGLHFRGCICIIHYRGREYRLATYLGARILACSRENMVLEQGKYRLEIQVDGTEGHRLRAPQNGRMSRTILETPSCPAKFSFYEKRRLVFRLRSRHASYEWEGNF